MIYDFQCLNCNHKFEKSMSSKDTELYIICPKCGKYAEKQFKATSNMFVPSYFHTAKSDIFTDTEWADLKKDPNIERA